MRKNVKEAKNIPRKFFVVLWKCRIFVPRNNIIINLRI